MSRLNVFPVLISLVLALSANAQAPKGRDGPPVSSAMDGTLFYQVLLGELNARSDEPGGAFSLMLDAARKTNDPGLYQRAVNIALEARSGNSALVAARAWKAAIPASRDANRYVFQILIGLNRVGETTEPLKRELALAGPMERAVAISSIPRYFAYVGDKKMAASIVEKVLTDYLAGSATGVSAWTTIGRMRFAAGDTDGALEAVRKAQTIDMTAAEPMQLAVVMMDSKVPQAETLVKKYLQDKVQPEVRMAYVRALLGGQRYAEALTQLQTATAEQPDYAQAWLVRGMIELQDGQNVMAEQTLQRYLELVVPKEASVAPANLGRSLTQAYLGLAQVAEQRKDFAAADAWLRRIDYPDDVLNAQLRRAHILARQGRLEQALDMVRLQPEKSAADARLKVGAEVELLRDAKQYRQAYSLLAAASDPDDFDQIYDLAILAEKLGDLDEMEQLLRRVIAGRPESAAAYNALGYALVDRNIRLPEARQLILKAQDLLPGDAMIADSLGWLEFRSGNLEQAQSVLASAFKKQADAEIAAHLGEVLWAGGHRDEAIAIWKAGVLIDANNEALLETLKRLRVNL